MTAPVPVPADGLAVRGISSTARAPVLGLQLFTILPLLEADFDATLARVAALGYREVETLGSFGRDPAMVREALLRHGLSSPAQHMMPGELYASFRQPPTSPAARAAMSRRFDAVFTPDAVDAIVTEAIARALVLGQRYVVWQLAWRPGHTLRDAERYATAFDRAGALCADAGLGFAYHNHDQEFVAIDGRRPFDLLVERTDPARVTLEIDFMWASKAGADARALLEQYPGRFRLCHLKDRSIAGEIVSTGDGIEDFAGLVAAAKAAGIEHFFFEFDRPGAPDAEMQRAAAVLGPLFA